MEENMTTIGFDMHKGDRLIHCFFICMLFLVTVASAMTGANDYPAHLSWLPDREDFFHPFGYFYKNAEPLWHYLTKILSVLFRIPKNYSGAIISGFCNVALYEIITRCWFKDIKGTKLITFLLLISGPLYIPWYNRNIYLGQGSPNVWHNPTLIMVKPFAVFITVMVLNVMKTPMKSYEKFLMWIKKGVGLSMLILLSAVAKPAFIQIFFPAIFIWCIIKTVTSKGRFLPNSLYLLACCLPALFVFLLQFCLTFVMSNNDASSGVATIGIKPFFAMKIWAPNVFFSPLLAVAFPVCVVLLTVLQRQKISDGTKFCWLMYLCAFAEAALLYEPSRPSHGNFGWGLLSLYYLCGVKLAGHFFQWDFI